MNSTGAWELAAGKKFDAESDAKYAVKIGKDWYYWNPASNTMDIAKQDTVVKQSGEWFRFCDSTDGNDCPWVAVSKGDTDPVDNEKEFDGKGHWTHRLHKDSCCCLRAIWDWVQKCWPMSWTQQMYFVRRLDTYWVMIFALANSTD